MGFQRDDIPLVGFGAAPHRPHSPVKKQAMPPKGGEQAKPLYPKHALIASSGPEDTLPTRLNYVYANRPNGYSNQSACHCLQGSWASGRFYAATAAPSSQMANNSPQGLPVALEVASALPLMLTVYVLAAGALAVSAFTGVKVVSTSVKFVSKASSSTAAASS